MARGVSWGIGQGIDGREAARQAAQQALDRAGTSRPVAAMIFAAHEFPMAEVFSGLTSLLGGMPLWGMSTSRPLTAAGEHPRSVVVAILSGHEWKAQTIWQTQFGRDSAAAGRELAKTLAEESTPRRGLLLAADGIQGDASQLLPALTGQSLPVAGGLASGELQLGKTYQFGGNQWANGALSGLALGGRLRLGTGIRHGWQDTGIHFKITRSRNLWLQTLDNQSSAEMYAGVFGTEARQWAFPPLSQLARLYPLGLEVTPGLPDRIVRSPLQVEVDGSFRMNTVLAEGQTAHLMVGDPQACLQGARLAIRQALAELHGARPVLAVVFIDYAWQLLFETRIGQLSATLREELGSTPMIGAYTLGQIAHPDGSELLRFHNQAFLAAILGEAQPS
jgi:hypothetical protein